MKTTWFYFIALCLIPLSQAFAQANNIRTIKPVVLYGPDTACIQSAIDVPFWSSGEYRGGNSYVAELSDANGSFALPNIIGSLVDSLTYDSTVLPLPGIVSGIIPNVPPGCNYYIRVVSTSPAITPPSTDYYGPFCLRQCDILTNDTTNLHFCISSSGDDTTISLKINRWNNNAQYAPGDSFQVQILSSTTYAVLNTGTFGTIVSNTDTTLKLTISGLQQLVNLLGSPGTGEYYMRLVALHSSTPWNTLGTLIRLTIGSIDSPAMIRVLDTLLCANAGGTVFFFADPPNIHSNYQWEVDPRISISGVPAGQPFYSPYPPPFDFGIDFSPGVTAGYYWVLTREVNNGCINPWSDSAHVRIIPIPSVNIIGPNQSCLNDSAIFTVDRVYDTYYQWSANNALVIDTSNNILRIFFDTTGQAILHILAINQCGSATGSDTVAIVKVNCDILLSTKELTAPDQLTVSPNPANTEVHLNPSGQGGYSYELYSLLGTRLQFNKENGTAVIDVSEIPAGIYFIRINMNDKIFQKKLIVIH